MDIIYRISPTGTFMDFGIIALGPDIHYTMDPAIPIDLALAYTGSTSTLQPDGSYLHTGGTWQYKTPVVITPPVVDPNQVMANKADIASLQALIATLSLQQTVSASQAESLATSLSTANSMIAKLKFNKAFKLSGVSDSTGKVTLDLTSYKFTVTPGIAFLPVVVTDGSAVPGTFPELVSISASQAVVRTRKIGSILGTGLVPQYVPNVGVNVDVIIIPKEPT